MKCLISRKILFLFLLICLVFTISCNEQPSPQEATHTEELPYMSEVETKLPEVEGYKTFYNSCRMCHSARYVLNQPDFSKETWTNIVTKMQKTFGAPISDAATQEVIQYLVTIKGKS